MCRPQRRGAAEPHTTAEHRHQLRIESALMREFCAYNKNCLRLWLAAQNNGSRVTQRGLAPERDNAAGVMRGQMPHSAAVAASKATPTAVQDEVLRVKGRRPIVWRQRPQVARILLRGNTRF